VEGACVVALVLCVDRRARTVDLWDSSCVAGEVFLARGCQLPDAPVELHPLDAVCAEGVTLQQRGRGVSPRVQTVPAGGATHVLCRLQTLALSGVLVVVVAVGWGP